MVEFTVFKGSISGAIQKGTTNKSLGRGEVLVRITHSGLCGTDVHYKQADMVLGHEGAGVVEEVGSEAKLFKKGDRVGWGYEHASCGHCGECLRGAETFCPDRAMYGATDLDQGSFASHAVWGQNFLFHIPDSIENKFAAPLMCGGATVFNSLTDVRSTDRVGIIGVGGLGHLAIQFAAKMGAEVVVFSGTERKREEAMKLGASEFHAMKGVTKLEGTMKPINHLMVTTSELPDWDLYVPALAPEAFIYPLSVSQGKIALPAMSFVLKGIKMVGKLVAARYVHMQMLEFAARHEIRPMIEEFPMTEEGIEEGFARLERGEIRYRAVFVAQ